MPQQEAIQLERTVEAIQIPYGQKITLPQGTYVMLMQVLGGSFTCQTDMGLLVRIEGKDHRALGQPEPVGAASDGVEGPGDLQTTVKRVWDQLKTCYDPEIPVNIVELGLVYECKVEPHPEGGFKALAKMTVTAPGCGMGGVLTEDARVKILAIPGIKEAHVELVWEPPWDQSRMSEAAKLQLGMM